MFAKAKDCPFKGSDNDYTSKEIRDLFASELREFRELTSDVRVFSKKLVPLFDGPAAAMKPQYDGKNALYGCSGMSRWYIWIDKPRRLEVGFNDSGGEDLVEISHAVLQDSGGRTVYSHKSSGYEEIETISSMDVEIKQPGLYVLECNGPAQTIRPLFPDDLKYVYEQSVEHSFHAQYFTPGYFYVPKGTGNVLLDYKTFLTIKAPSWAKPGSYDETKQGLLSIPVGEDDGKIWELRHVTASHFQFLNIPPYVATSRENLLVPTEVVEKDRQ